MTAVVTAPRSAARPFAGRTPLVRHPGPLRFLPVPDTEPPVERGDILPGSSSDPAQGVLALLPADVEDDEALFGPRATPSRELPDPARWGRRITQLLVEVLVGQRPSAQLVRWTSDEVYRRIRQRVRPVTAGRDRTRAAEPRLRHVVGGVRVSEPQDGVAEVAAVVHGPRRAHALALRLEGRDGRWVVTVLQDV